MLSTAGTRGCRVLKWNARAIHWGFQDGSGRGSPVTLGGWDGLSSSDLMWLEEPQLWNFIMIFHARGSASPWEIGFGRGHLATNLNWNRNLLFKADCENVHGPTAQPRSLKDLGKGGGGIKKTFCRILKTPLIQPAFLYALSLEYGKGHWMSSQAHKQWQGHSIPGTCFERCCRFFFVCVTVLTTFNF